VDRCLDTIHRLQGHQVLLEEVVAADAEQIMLPGLLEVVEQAILLLHLQVRVITVVLVAAVVLITAQAAGEAAQVQLDLTHQVE